MAKSSKKKGQEDHKTKNKNKDHKTGSKSESTKTVTHHKPKHMKKSYKELTIILGIVSIVFIILFSLAITTDLFKKGTSVKKMPAEEVKVKTQTMIDNLLQGRAKAEIKDVKYNEDSGLYEMTILINGEEQPTAYASADGKIFFPQGLPITTEEKTGTTKNNNEQKTDVPKTDKPKAELFIMSYCPFGLQMQKAFVPVMELLGDKADLSIKWVNYAMHGKKEIDENLRQYCIEQIAPEKYPEYARCFVESTNYTTCLQKAGIDIDALNKCMSDTDTKYHIMADYEDKSTWAGGRFPKFAVYDDLNQQYGVRGSPTFVINGVTVQIPRSSEAIKEAICSAFNNPPAECNTALNENQEAPGPGPIGGGSGTNTGSAGCGA